jgi:hypothetical protein
VILADGRTSRGGRRRRPIVRVLLVVLLLVLVFLLGVAFGRVLDEQDEPGGLVTTVRTVTPLPRQPPARTVTVTVTEP